MTTPSSPDAPASPGNPARGNASEAWRRLVGDWSWQPPAWLLAARDWLKKQPPGRYVAVFALLLAGALGYAWLTRPKVLPPGAIAVTVTAPTLTDYSKTPIVVNPLVLRFAGSAAPIALVGDKVSAEPAGLQLEPELAGTWKWTDDKSLSFQPATDWPVGQHYTLKLDPKLAVARGVVLAEDEFEFDSAPFAATLVKGEFYQDPVDPNLKKAVFELTFSHPVDAATLEKRLAMSMVDGAGAKQPSPQQVVSYDERRLAAFVHSAPLTLPENGGKLTLAVDKGIASTLGGNGSKEALTGEVALPTLYSVSVDSLEASLVDNERYEPEQVLVLGFNNAMKDSEVAGATRAWLLP